MLSNTEIAVQGKSDYQLITRSFDGKPKRLDEATDRKVGEAIIRYTNYINCTPESSGDLKVLEETLARLALTTEVL